jgi:hypothetical protein
MGKIMRLVNKQIYTLLPYLNLIMATVAIYSNAYAEETYSQAEFEQALTLSVDIASQFSVGEAIPFSAKLCAKREITVDTLDTSDGGYSIVSIDRIGQPHHIGGIRTGNEQFINYENSKNNLSGGDSYGRKWELISLPNDKITLKPKQCIEKTYEATSLMKVHAGPCNCTLLAEYYYGFLKLSAKAEFRVVVDYPKTIPYLLDLLETGDADAKIWARGYLWSLTDREMPTWDTSNRTEPAHGEVNINELRKWWEEHKDEERFKNRTHEDILKLW